MQVTLPSTTEQPGNQTHTVAVLSATAVIPNSEAMQQLIAKQSDWAHIWNWLRHAPSMPVLRQRIEAVIRLYPGKDSSNRREHYAESLWRSRATWAVMLHTWQVTYGLTASSLQEGLHWTWKCPLSNCSRNLRLFQLPEHFRVTMAKKFVARSLVGVKALRTLKAEVTEQGFSKLLSKMQLCLTDEGLQLALEQLLASAAYDVQPVGDGALPALLDRCTHRGTSLLRFRCLCAILAQESNLTHTVGASNSSSAAPVASATGDSAPTSAIGKFWQVSARKSGQVDIVFVNHSGGVCGTNPWGHQHAFPDECTFAVFRTGGLALNPALHWQHVYHAAYLVDLPLDAKLSMSATADHPPANTPPPTQITGECVVDFASTATKTAWAAYCDSGDPTSAFQLNPTTTSSSRGSGSAVPEPSATFIAASAPAQLKSSSVSKSQTLTKTFRELLPDLLSNPELLEDFAALSNKAKDKRATTALKTLRSRTTAETWNTPQTPTSSAASASSTSTLLLPLPVVDTSHLAGTKKRIRDPVQKGSGAKKPKLVKK